MTQHDDDLLAAWVSEGPQYGSPAALELALERTRSVRQRSGWTFGRPGMRGRPDAGGQHRFTWTAAAVTSVLAAAVGLSFMALSSPGHVPAVAPHATVSPSPSPRPRALYNSTPLQLLAGTYLVNHVYAGRATITVPSGWTGVQSGPGQAILLKARDGGRFGDVPNSAWVTISAVRDVYADPCRDKAPASPAPSSVDELVFALTHQVGYSAGPVTDTTIGGLPAKVFDVAVAATNAKCPNEPLTDWRYTAIPGEYVTNRPAIGGVHNRSWIVDVKGTYLLILAGSPPDAQAADLDEAYQIVDSITFE
jgi:hypothetical protein